MNLNQLRAQPTHRLLRVFVCISAAACGWLAYSQTAHAQWVGTFQPSFHSYNDDDCERRDAVDPVGAIFRGTAAERDFMYDDNDFHDFRFHTGWQNFDAVAHSPTNTQWFSGTYEGNGFCKDHDSHGDSASNSGIRQTWLGPRTRNRWHMRARYYGSHSIFGRGYVEDEIRTTPHYDIACGNLGHRVAPAKRSNDYVSGFDRARRELKQRYKKPTPHRHQIERGVGNTARVQQGCDGGMAGGNGVVLYISVGKVPADFPE